MFSVVFPSRQLSRKALLSRTSAVGCLFGTRPRSSLSVTRRDTHLRLQETRPCHPERTLRFGPWQTGELRGGEATRRTTVTTTQGQNLAAESLPHLAPYKPPTTGLISRLPARVIPYAELVRLDKPVGTYYLFLPCLFSTLMAASLTDPIASPAAVAYYSSLFLTGAYIMRGAGCTINDLWDRNLDPHVERTRLRPIARGAVSPQSALIFTGAQMLAGLVLLLQFPLGCVVAALPSVLLVGSYPLAKRVTNYPQFVLGLTFSWGAFLGFPTMGIDLLDNTAAATAAVALYTSNVAWTVLYDMIYAHMDVKDDAKAGIKSIALRHEKETKPVLAGLAAVQIGLLAFAGSALGFGPVFFVGSCGGAAATLGYMIWKVNLKQVSSCWWWFRNGCWFTGGAITLGLMGEYASQLSKEENTTHKAK